MRHVWLAVVLGGCSLYPDDDPTGVDAGGDVDAPPSIDGTWRVEWECATTCGTNPLAANADVNVSSSGEIVSIAWPASHVEHTGSWNGFCLDVAGGEDEGMARASYSVCVDSSPRIMIGSVTWVGGGQWRLTLQR